MSSFSLPLQKESKLRRFIKIFCQIWFYAVAIFAFLKILNLGPHIGIRDTIYYLFPIYDINWFAFTYLILMIWMPFLNKIMSCFNRKFIEKGLILATILWVIFPTFLNTYMASSTLIWFIYLYMVGGYIRFYGIDKKLTHINWRRYSIFLFIVLIFARFFLGVLNFKFTFLKINAASVYELNSLLILILAVSIFFWFLNLHLEKNMFVNNLASTMFGVYLISDHPIVRSLIWHNLFHNALFSNSIYLIWHCFWVIPTVFFVCAFIDWLRLKLIEKPLMYKYGYMIDMWQGHMDSFDIPKLFK